jgi:alpha-beta hydrolase superfamily lysophospholipase
MAPAAEFWMQSKDGTRLFGRRWALESPRAAVAIVHGYAEHSGRYNHVAAMLNTLGLDVFALDVRGHGRSDGARGHAADYNEYIDDVRVFLDEIRKVSPTRRILVLGHSNGGLITLLYALDPAPDVFACVVTAPFLGTAMKVPGWKSSLGKIMSAVYPKLSLPSGLPTQGLSHDPEVVRAYENDPLVFPTATAGWFTAALAAQDRVKREAGRIALPILVMQGMADPLVDASMARPLFDAIGSSDKKYVEYPGLYHEIMNEVEKDKVLADIRAWIEPRL